MLLKIISNDNYKKLLEDQARAIKLIEYEYLSYTKGICSYEDFLFTREVVKNYLRKLQERYEKENEVSIK